MILSTNKREELDHYIGEACLSRLSRGLVAQSIWWVMIIAVKSRCEECGYYDASHGKQKDARRFERGWCSKCWDRHANLVRQAEQCCWAHDYIQRGEFLVLDSETSGLDFQQDEIIELSLVTGFGAILFNSLIQPEDPDRYGLATHIHGITTVMLKMAPRFPDAFAGFLDDTVQAMFPFVALAIGPLPTSNRALFSFAMTTFLGSY